MNNQFSIRRLGYLGRNYFINNWRSLVIAAGVISGVTFIMTVFEAWVSSKTDMEYGSMLIGSMVIWGIINASMAFHTLHDKNHNEAYLLLPASALEKVSVKILFSSLVLPLGIMVLIGLTSILSEGVTAVIFRTGFHPLNPFRPVFFQVWGYTVIAQSLFILGAAWFRKAHFIKTVLALIIGAIGLALVSGILFRIVFASYFEGFFTPIEVNFDMESLMAQHYPGLMNFLKYAWRIVFYLVLAPFCWFTAWLRVKETQSSDGV